MITHSGFFQNLHVLLHLHLKCRQDSPYRSLLGCPASPAVPKRAQWAPAAAAMKSSLASAGAANVVMAVLYTTKNNPAGSCPARAVIMLRANVVGNYHDASFFFDVTSDITRTFQTSGPTGEQAQTTHRTDTDKQKRGAGPRLLRRATLQDQVGKKSAPLPSRRQAQSKPPTKQNCFGDKTVLEKPQMKSRRQDRKCNKVLRH